MGERKREKGETTTKCLRTASERERKSIRRKRGRRRDGALGDSA